MSADSETLAANANQAPGRLAGRVALVTGASRGIGAAAAVGLAQAGAHVVLVARGQGGLEETDDAVRAVGGAATLLPLDLSDHDKIDQLILAIGDRFRRLDIVVGAAGMLPGLRPAGHYGVKDWARTLDVNLTANWRLIRACDEPLRLSDAGRMVFLTCGAARAPEAYWGAYAASKAALEQLTLCYAAEVTKTNLRVNLYDPGPTFTRLRELAFPGEERASLAQAEDHVAGIVDLVAPDCVRHGEVVRYAQG